MNRLSKIIAIAMIVMLGVTSATAKVHKKRVTPQGLYLKAKEVVPFLKKHKNTLFVDVRSQAELEFVGCAYSMDKNIPWLFKDFAKWNGKKHRFGSHTNKNFIADIQKALKAKGLNKDDIILLMCRSGSRSTKAAKALFKAGYKKVYNIVDGFEGGKSKKTKHRTVNGWKNQAPMNSWGYKLDKSKMYGLK